MECRVLARRAVVAALCVVFGVAGAPPAAAEPEPDAVVEPVAATVPPDGAVASSAPATVTAPDDWTLTVSAENETQLPVPPLTTALTSRDYIVGGTFNGLLSGPEEPDPPHGVLEVGYQIGCGIDMSTSQGVTLSGSAGVTSSVGLAGADIISPLPEGFLPVLTVPVSGAVAVGLKPGIVNIVPVTKKEYAGAEPWVMISNFHIKVDGCVGQSFIRSYATLTRSTPMSEAILSYYGVTKVV